MMWKRTRTIVFSCLFFATVFPLCRTSHAAEGDLNQLVISGVIVSNHGKHSIVMLSKAANGKVRPYQEGQELFADTVIQKISRRYVDIAQNGQTYRLEVGGNRSVDLMQPVAPSNAPTENISTETDTSGSKVVRLSESYKDHLLNVDLSKILMQAASEPNFENGRLHGFKLWDIEPKSVYEIAGLQNGDLVTKINEFEINDVGMTLRMLNSLRSAPNAKIQFVRDGVEKNISLVIQ